MKRNCNAFEHIIAGILLLCGFIMPSFAAYRVNLNFFVGNSKVKMVGVTSGDEYTVSEYAPDVTPYVCRDYAFLGWKVGSPVRGDEIPTLAETITPVANVNLYAVFDKGSVNDYERIMSMEELTPNKYLIVSYHIYGGEKNFYAMNTITGTYAYGDYNSWGKLGGNRVWPQEQDNIIYDPEDTYIWHIMDTVDGKGETKYMITVDDGDGYLYVGSNHDSWMLYNDVEKTKEDDKKVWRLLNEITCANGEFVIRKNLTKTESVPSTDTIFIAHDSIISQDTSVVNGDTVYNTVDSIWYDTIMPIPAHTDTIHQYWYLNYVTDEISMMEDFFITDTAFDQYPIYLYKKASSYTSYPKCEEWTSHYDAVEGFIKDSLGCENFKTLNVTGKFYPNGLDGGYGRGYYMFHPQGCLPHACGTEWSFAGWAMEEPVKPTRIRPTLRTINGFKEGGQAYNDEHLYAVYSKGIYYTKVTDTTELHDGDVCIIVSKNRKKAVQVYKSDAGWWSMEDVTFSPSGDTIVSIPSKESEWTYRAWDNLFINGARYLSDQEKYSDIFKIREKNPPYTLSISGSGGARYLSYAAPSGVQWLSYNYVEHWFYRNDQNSGGYTHDYWSYNVYRKNNNGDYVLINSTSELNDNDKVIVVLLDPWAEDDGWALGENVILSDDGFDYCWHRKNDIPINGNIIYSTDITSDRVKWTYHASNHSLWNARTGHVLADKWDESKAYELYDSSEGLNMNIGMGEPCGRFWLRYADSTPPFYSSVENENGEWWFNIFRKSNNSYVRVQHSSELLNGDTLVVVTENLEQALTYTTSTTERWNQTEVYVTNDTITSLVGHDMKWEYNSSNKTLTHDGHIFSYRGYAGEPFVVYENMWGAGEGHFVLTHHDASYNYLTWLNFSEDNTDWVISPSAKHYLKNYYTEPYAYKDLTDSTMHGEFIDNIYFDIYKKSDDAEYSSYPHCASYAVTLHACGGVIGNSSNRDTIIEETNVGQGFTLPTCTADCDGWEFVGWFPDEDKQSFEMMEFKEFYAPGTVFVPKNDGAELFAIYKRKADKFKIVRGGLNTLVDGDEYLMTYYTKVNGSVKIYDQEITGVKYNDKYLRAKQGESPQNGDDYYMIEKDPANIWYITKKAGSDNQFTFQNVKSGQYLQLGASSPYSRTSSSVQYVYILDAGKNFEFNVCCKNGNTYYAAICDKYGRFTTNKRYLNDRGLYAPYVYIYRRMKEYSSWPHCEPFSVHFVGCGGTVEVTDVSETVRYSGVVTPEATPSLECAKMGWEFAGWYKKPIYKELFELSFDIVPGSSHYTPAAKSDTLYAVYQQRTDRYDRIFGIPDLHLGGNYIIATTPDLSSSKRNKALSNTLNNDNNPSKIGAINVTPFNDTITNEDPSIVWRLAGNWGEYVLYNMNRKVYIDMSEPSKLMFAASDTTDQVDITYDETTGYKFRSVHNISSNDDGEKFLGYNSGEFISVANNTSNLLPLAIYRQECYYQSFPECYQEVEALYWNKKGTDITDYWVTVESYLLRGTPDLHNSIGNPKENGDGTFDIRYHAGLMRPCTRALMTWDGITSEFRVPYIVSDDTTTHQLLLNNKCDTCDVVVTKGHTLTVDEDRTIRILTLQDSSTLNVLDGKKLRAQQVVLFSDGDQNTPYVNLNSSGEIILKNGELYIDRRIDENRFYWFTLPFDAKVSEINFSNEEANGGKPKYDVEENGGFFLNFYDGARRAREVNNGTLTAEAINNGATYWTRVPYDATLRAGQGYQVGLYDQWGIEQADGRHHRKRVIRFTTRPDGYQWNKQEHNLTKIIPIEASTVDNHLNAVHAGWNLIGNPYLNSYTTGSNPGISGLRTGAWKGDTVNGSWVGWILDESRPTNVPYLTLYNFGYRRYYQVLASDYTFKPSEVVFVQVESGNGIMMSHNPTVSNKPSRLRVSEYEAPLYTGIKLSGEGMEDVTGVVLSDEFSDEYEIGGDLAKMASSNYLNLYSFNNEERKCRLAFNGLSDFDKDSVMIPIGVVFSKAGMYTFSFDEKRYDITELETLTLIDKVAKETADLTSGNYQVNIEKAGSVENRFYLVIRRVKNNNTTTNVKDVVNSDVNKPVKIIRNGILYIKYNNKVYDMLGNQTIR